MGKEYQNQGTKVNHRKFSREVSDRLTPTPNSKIHLEDKKAFDNSNYILEEPDVSSFLLRGFLYAKHLVNDYIRS